MVKCHECGREVSEHYSFCPNCHTTIHSKRASKSKRPTKTGRTHNVSAVDASRLNLPSTIRNLLGELNTYERYFALAFFLSILFGFVYGLLDRTLSGIASIPFPSIDVGPLPVSILSQNILTGVVSVLTGGVGGLVANFVAFASIAATLEARDTSVIVGVLFMLFLFATVEPFELGGFLCFATVGFAGMEWVLWKRRTKLHLVRLLILGTVLMFVAAVIEWSLVVFLTGFANRHI